MATRLVQSENNGRLVLKPVTDNRRPFVVNGRLGEFTPQEIAEEMERRRERADHAPVFEDDPNDYDYQ